jgi:hypothetical protein
MLLKICCQINKNLLKAKLIDIIEIEKLFDSNHHLKPHPHNHNNVELFDDS